MCCVQYVYIYHCYCAVFCERVKVTTSCSAGGVWLNMCFTSLVFVAW